MGHMRHHAIVVTSWHAESLDKMHTAAVQLGCSVTPICDSRNNGYASFAVLPDGSKETWDASNDGDRQREKLWEHIHAEAYEDGSNPIDAVEVMFGGDLEGAYIIEREV